MDYFQEVVKREEGVGEKEQKTNQVVKGQQIFLLDPAPEKMELEPHATKLSLLQYQGICMWAVGCVR